MKNNADRPPPPGAINPLATAARRLAPGLIAHLLKSAGSDPVPALIARTHAEFTEFCEAQNGTFNDWRKAWNVFRFQPSIGEAIAQPAAPAAPATTTEPVVAPKPKASRRRKGPSGAGPTPVVFDPFAAAPSPTPVQPAPPARPKAKAGFVYVPPPSPLRVVRVVTPGADGSNIVSVSFAPEPERSEPVADPEPSVSEETAARWLHRLEQRRLATALAQE